MSSEPSPGPMPDLAASLRQHDRDRFMTTLFAPADRRGDLVALYSFNFEVAKTREVVREKLLGRIRLQWWREAIDEIYGNGKVRRHEVVQPLAEAIRRHDLPRALFDRLIDAREADLEEMPPPDLGSLERYAEDSAGGLAVLALAILGASDAATVAAGREVGAAWALVGAARALPFHAAARRVTLPAALTAAHGLDERDFFELRPSAALAAIVAELAQAAQRRLDAARRRRRRPPRRALPALILATTARAQLRRLERAGYNPFDPGIAQPDPLAAWRLTASVLTGRY